MRSNYQTPARRALLALFKTHADRHFTAEQVLDCLSCADGDRPPVGKSTVYRQLNGLCEQKQLRRFEHVTPDGTVVHVYQYCADTRCDRHFHLKCRVCGRIQHLECDMTDELTRHILADHAFAVDCGLSILYGLCAACGADADPYANKETSYDH